MDVELAEIRDFLAQHAPFDALPPQVLDGLPARCTLRYARRGTTVLAAGGANDRLFVVRSGAVDITDAGQLVDRVGAGGSFGMSATVENAPNRYDAVAREDTLLLTLPQAEVEALASGAPDVAVHFAATHHGRIKTALGRMQQPHRGSAVLKTSVRDLLRGHGPVSAGPDVTVSEAAREMTTAGVSSLLIMEDDRLVGIVTDRDLRRRVLAVALDPATAVREVMTADPVTVQAEALAFEAMLEMTGRNIHHLPVLDVSGSVLGLVTTTDLIRLEQSNPVYLVADLRRQDTVEGVVEQARRIPTVVEQLVSEDASARDIGRVTATLTDAVARRMIELAEAELGPPPADYAWASLGSVAREEMALGGDQDHALVLADGADPQHPWWGELAERVTAGMEAYGLHRCPGEVMATNPRWRMTATQWHGQFSRWAFEPQPDAVLRAAIFFDMRPVHGDHDLVHELRRQVVPMGGRSDLLLAYLAGQAARTRPPIGFFRGFVLEHAGEHRDTLDIKRGLSTIVQIARVHALRARSSALDTPSRLQAAQAAGLLGPESAADLADALELLSRVRLRHQVGQIREGRTPDNHLNPASLSSLERRHLRDAFQIVRTAQQGLTSRLPQVT